MQTECRCVPNTQNFQTHNNTRAERSNNTQSNDFNAGSSLSGSAETDQLLIGLITLIVQLLLQQFTGNQQGQQEQADGNGGELDFSDRDKALLLDAIGQNSADTQINSILDTDSSEHLNAGDGLELQNNAGTSNHNLTNTEVRDFLEARNPSDTPRLNITQQQVAILDDVYGLADVAISDTSGDGVISEGDFISGNQGTTGSQRIDIPVDQELADLLNKGRA